MLMFAKYPQLQAMAPPDSKDFAFLKITPKVISVPDYTKGFEWCEGQPEAMTRPQRARYERLARLLRAQRVEIRVLPDASFGLIHGKAGVIRYADGRSTCFLGSINETGEAWSRHYELLWEDEDLASVAWVQAEFEALWTQPRCPAAC